jgi:hypothetical protein
MVAAQSQCTVASQNGNKCIAVAAIVQVDTQLLLLMMIAATLPPLLLLLFLLMVVLLLMALAQTQAVSNP